MRFAADLSPLLADDALTGRVPDDLDGRQAEILGRALGTYARRQGLLKGSFVLSLLPLPDTAGGPSTATRAVRDGLVRGLLQAGHDVTDVGEATDEQHAAALVHLAHESGARLSEADGACTLRFLLDGAPLGRDALAEVCAIAAAGDLSAGFGALRVVDLHAALAAEQARDAAGSAAGASTSVTDHPAPELSEDNPALAEETLVDDEVFHSSDED